VICKDLRPRTEQNVRMASEIRRGEGGRGTRGKNFRADAGRLRPGQIAALEKSRSFRGYFDRADVDLHDEQPSEKNWLRENAFD